MSAADGSTPSSSASASADPFVRGQRVRLPTGGGERGDQLGVQRFPQRVFGGQAFQLVEVELAMLGDVEPAVLEPGRDGRGERGVEHVGERRPTPLPLGVLVAPGSRQRFEPAGVDVLGGDGQHVPGRLRLDRDPGAPEPRDQRLQRVRRPTRRVVAPQPVDQRLGRDQPAGLKGEQNEQRAQPRPADLDRSTGVVENLERAEDLDAHALKPASRRRTRSHRRG